MMTERDPEGELRARVQQALTAMPGPNPARLAASRPRTAVQPRRRARQLWLAAALALGVGSGAAAAWWIHLAEDRLDRGQAGEDAQGQAETGESLREEDRRAEGSTDAADSEPAGNDADDRDKPEPVIFRD